MGRKNDGSFAPRHEKSRNSFEEVSERKSWKGLRRVHSLPIVLQAISDELPNPAKSFRDFQPQLDGGSGCIYEQVWTRYIDAPHSTRHLICVCCSLCNNFKAGHLVALKAAGDGCTKLVIPSMGFANEFEKLDFLGHGYAACLASVVKDLNQPYERKSSQCGVIGLFVWPQPPNALRSK